MAQYSEILIVGGGVIGLAIARSLHKAGVRDIAILEAETLGCGASSAAAGMLAPQAEADRADTFFDMCRDSLALYPHFAEELASETDIDIQLDRTGTLYIAFDHEDLADLERRFEWQQDAGLNVEKLDRVALLGREKSLSEKVLMGLYFPDDWQVENRRLIKALIRSAELNEILIHENSRAEQLVIEKGRVTGVKSGNRRYLAKTIILTTGAWTSTIKFGDNATPVAVKPIRGQMISFWPARPIVSHVIYSRRGYLVPRADGRVLAGATVEDAGFEIAVTETGVESLRTAAAEIAPILGDEMITEMWSGLRPFAADGMPLIGRVPGFDNVSIATGHYRNGILLAPITAELIASQLANESGSRYLEEFCVARFERAHDAGN